MEIERERVLATILANITYSKNIYKKKQKKERNLKREMKNFVNDGKIEEEEKFFNFIFCLLLFFIWDYTFLPCDVWMRHSSLKNMHFKVYSGGDYGWKYNK